MPKPPATRAPGNAWPQWPRIFRVDYGACLGTRKQWVRAHENAHGQHCSNLIKSTRFCGSAIVPMPTYASPKSP
eukprot:1142679-Pelagomonas_calceolata.AAC.11